jgi:lipoprotein NlpD
MRAPVFEGEKMVARAGPPSASDTYVTKAGDTLYSVAWNENLDVRALALWNGLSPEAGISPGQRLSLTPPVHESEAVQLSGDEFGPIGDIHALQQGKAGTQASPSLAQQAAPVTQPQTRSQAQTFGVQDEPAPVQMPSKQAIAATPDNSKSQLVAKASQLQASNAAAAPSSGRLNWQRPTVGTLVRSYSPDDVTRKGVHIGGREGQPIKATEAGKVVYSGTGLVGYGNLVIVKHDNNYLSAYGNNKKNLVKEGDMVTAGQQVAEMGRSDKGDPLLHFEIRYQGKPINPASVLSL